MKTYAERLTYAMSQREVSQSDLARAVGVKPQNIQHLCKVGKSSGKSHQIAKYLCINPDWLTEGTGQWDYVKSSRNYQQLQTPNKGKVMEDRFKIYEIPVISWPEATRWPDFVDQNKGNIVEKELILTSKLTSQYGFALKITTNEFENPQGQPSLQNGMTIIVDPAITPTHGKVVIVHMNGTDTAMKYTRVAGTEYLEPIKPGYPPAKVTSDMTIAGVVIAAEIDL